MSDNVQSNQNAAVVQQQAAPAVQQAPQATKLQLSEDFYLTQVGQEFKRFEVLQRMACMYAGSSLVPKAYQGKENIGNCVIALDMAARMQANPLMVMQNLFVVYGTPSFSSKFLIATINACGRFTSLRYEFRGEEGKLTHSCRAYAYEVSDKEHKEPLYGDWVSLQMAHDEGWSTKSGSKWKTMPGQMLRYRAAAFWQRVFAPEISMGFLSTEEAVDISEVPVQETVTEKKDRLRDKKKVTVPELP